MNVKTLIAVLSRMSPDFEVDITKVIAASPGGSIGPFQLTFDAPIVGIAEFEDTVSFIIEADSKILGVGNVINMAQEQAPRPFFANAMEVNGEFRIIDTPPQRDPRLPTEAARNLSSEGRPMHVVRIEVIGTYQGDVLHPNWAVPPGEHLREILDHLELTVLNASKLTSIEPERFMEILNGTTKVSEEDAEKLSSLRYTKQFWVNLETNYQKAVDQKAVPS